VTRKLVLVLVVFGAVAAAGYFGRGAVDGSNAVSNVAQVHAARPMRFGPPSTVLVASRVLGKRKPSASPTAPRRPPPLRSSRLTPGLLYRSYVAVLPGGRRVHFSWNYVRLSRTCAVPVGSSFPVQFEPLPVGTGCRRLGFAGIAFARSGSVRVPLLRTMPIGRALKTVHAAGLRASFGAIDNPCADPLPYVRTQWPPAGKHVPARSVVHLSLQADPYPSMGVPIHHKKWTYIASMVGHEFGYVKRHLDAVAGCVHVNAASGTDATRLVVVSQHPAPGTRVRAYGVRLPSGGFRPTTVALTLGPP
jgi:hypothetical protein